MASPAQSAPPFNFADSVQRFPCRCPDELRLVAFDWEGCRQFELISSRADADDAEVALLRLCRETHPAPRPAPPLRLS